MIALFVVRSQFTIFDETSLKMKRAQMYEYFRINFIIFIVEVYRDDKICNIYILEIFFYLNIRFRLFTYRQVFNDIGITCTMDDDKDIIYHFLFIIWPHYWSKNSLVIQFGFLMRIWIECIEYLLLMTDIANLKVQKYKVQICIAFSQNEV